MDAVARERNPSEGRRIGSLVQRLRKRRLAAALVSDRANVRALTDVDCDAATLLVTAEGDVTFYTDFRYAPAIRRLAPSLAVRDVRRLKRVRLAGRVGFESSLSHARVLKLGRDFRRATFVDIREDLEALRAVKTADEIARLRAAEALDCDIWEKACAAFRAGMTEREMAGIIRKLMIDLGEGEAFETIVCVGANAAECHHVPDDTVWNGRDAVLVDMGVKLGGVCSDLTRNVLPKRMGATYRRVYNLVRDANRAAIAAAKPGMTCGQLDRVARKMIAAGGFGKCFGHSLGHGVGYEIHETPSVRRRDRTVLKPGMVVTVEPGIYLEGNLGVRIEDLILITEDGCEVLSR